MNIKNRIRRLESEALPVGGFCNCRREPLIIIQTTPEDNQPMPETCEICGRFIERIEFTFNIKTA